jgi:hypothetical protein
MYCTCGECLDKAKLQTPREKSERQEWLRRALAWAICLEAKFSPRGSSRRNSAGRRVRRQQLPFQPMPQLTASRKGRFGRGRCRARTVEGAALPAKAQSRSPHFDEALESCIGAPHRHLFWPCIFVRYRPPCNSARAMVQVPAAAPRSMTCMGAWGTSAACEFSHGAIACPTPISSTRHH